MAESFQITTETYERLLEINRRILSQTHLDRLLDLILDEALELSRAERGFIVLLGRGIMEVRAARNLDKMSLKKAREKLSTSIIREVTAKQGPVLTIDAAGEGRLAKAASIQRMKLRSVLAVPLKVGEEIRGVIYLDNRFAAGAFGEAHAKVLARLADQAALAIQNARLLEENVQRQSELETHRAKILELNRALEEKIQLQQQEIESARLKLQSRQEDVRDDRYTEIIGRSKPMREVLRTLDRIMDSDVTVTIHGASGTGKELIARALHANGPRKGRIFVSTNCAAYSETLLESELFGHVRGAFTGADRDKKGIFEYADGGTVFLDEVADMSRGMQAKLLRVLQEREIRRVGSNQPIQVDVRIVSATNRDLGELVREGKFRKDLYYRLNVVKIELPSLRERTADIPELVDHFMKRNKMGIPESFLSIDPGAMKALMAHDWPGNIRELENEINRALIMGKGAITRDLLSETVREKTERPEGLAGGSGLHRQLADHEKRIIEEALREAKGNKARAAALLGISRITLHQKIKAMKIDAGRRKLTAQEIARALADCGGNKAKAAKILGIKRQTLYYQMERLGIMDESAGATHPPSPAEK